MFFQLTDKKTRVDTASQSEVQMTMNPLYYNMIRAWNFKKVRVICSDMKRVSDVKDLILGGTSKRRSIAF